MSVTVYKALKHRILAGKKLYLNNAWKTIPANAKMWLNGAWHKIGFSGSQNPVDIPTPPTIPDVPAQSLTHDNGTEPSTGTIWYITPEGAGNMDGSSWANAASGSMIHVILLSCSSGDSVYFSEGDYTIDHPITLPAGVSLYGGFDADTPAWATRNGFTRQTVFTGNGTFGWMNERSATSDQIVDGFVVKNYNFTISGRNAKLRNSIVTMGTAGTINNHVYNCVFISAAATVQNAKYCNFFYGNTTVSSSAIHVNVYGTESAKVKTSIYGAHYCTAVNCTNADSNSNGYSYIFGNGATNCTAVNCTNTDSNSNSFSFIFGHSAENCTAVNCTNTSNGYSYIFGDDATTCTAVNCSSNNYIFIKNATNCTAVNCTNTRIVFAEDATNCTAVNCTSNNTIFIRRATNCTAVNCTNTGFVFSQDATTCTAVNCSSDNYIFEIGATNCTAVNCSNTKRSSNAIFGIGATNCTAVNCTGNSTSTSNTYIFGNGATNCLSWNNSGPEYNYSNITTCAGSNYVSWLTLTLGTDNTIARFTNTGYYPAQGVQDVGDCPNPITDPTGFAAWIAVFGDWHPLANSFLVGRGTADSDVTTDADGVARPDPPTIGAYEPVPASA